MLPRLRVLALALAASAATACDSAPAPPSVPAPAPASAPAPAPAPAPPPAPPEGAPAVSLEETVRALGVEVRGFRTWFEAEGKAVTLFRTPGAGAPDAWRKLRAAVDRTGHWPVLVGQEEDLRRIEEAAEAVEPGERAPSRILAAAEGLDPWSVFREAAEEDPDDYRAERGEWPEYAGSMTEVSIHRNLTDRSILPEVHVALVPTKVGHEVPAWLCWGGWNDCPAPEEHVAVLRSWNGRFGAELAVLSGDVLELVRVRPPEGKADLLDTAREQFLYCPDLVHQEEDTLDGLAATLDGSTVWWFWWD